MRIAVVLVLSGCSFLDVRGPARPVRHDTPVECTDKIGLPVVDSIVGISGLALGGVMYAGTREYSSDEADVAMLVVGVPLLVIGVLDTASAIYGYSTVSDCRRAQQEHQRVLEAAAQREQQRRQLQDRAWTQTKAAARAARDGDCVQVATLEIEVREVDVEFHRTVFVRDPAIARCLATPAAGSASGPP